jgi:putative transposase
MPEHAHVLILPRLRVYDISTWLSSFKLGVTRRALRYIAQHHPRFLKKLEDRKLSGKKTYRFWQPGGGVDVNLWTDSKIWDKINYIHNNPVRRRLVEKPEDWIWSSYRDYLEHRPVGPVIIDWETLPADPRSET